MVAKGYSLDYAEAIRLTEGLPLTEAKESLRRSRDLLNRPGFADKAPANVVANEKAKLAEREERVRLLEEEIRRAA